MEYQYYWQLVERDGTVTHVPPQHVAAVQKRLDNEQVIHFSTHSVPHHQVVKFSVSERVFSDKKLLTEAAQAFRTPIIKETVMPDGRKEVSIEARWVKRKVTQERYNKFYSKSPDFHKLGEYAGMVVIAYVVPTHQVNTEETDYLSTDEIRRVDKSVNV